MSLYKKMIVPAVASVALINPTKIDHIKDVPKENLYHKSEIIYLNNYNKKDNYLNFDTFVYLVINNKFNEKRMNKKIKQFKVDSYYLNKYAEFFNVPKEIVHTIYKLENSLWEDVSISKKYGPMQIGMPEFETLMYYFVQEDGKIKKKPGWLSYNYPDLYKKIKETMKKYGNNFIKLKYSLKGKNEYEKKEILDSYFAISTAYIKWIMDNAPERIKKNKDAWYLYTISAYHAGKGLVDSLIEKRGYNSKHFIDKKEFKWLVRILDKINPTISRDYLVKAYDSLQKY